MVFRPFKPPSFVSKDATANGNRPAGSPFKRQRQAPADDVLQPISPKRANTGTQTADPNRRTFYVVYRKSTTKKHKTWDGDGVLIVEHDGTCRLQDENGRDLARSKAIKQPINEAGDAFTIGGKECEVTGVGTSTVVSASAPPLVKQEQATPRPRFQTPAAGLRMNLAPPIAGQTRHDIHAEGALILPRPLLSENTPVVDVVVDPIIARKMRPHQREGIAFLYQCVTGQRQASGDGAILADEMGLGKTLQVIALLWTLLKQNTIPDRGPIIKRALIVCPVTLLGNWKREFRKWLGQDRVGVFVVDAKSQLSDFTKGRVYQVMLIGYERLVTVSDELNAAKFDIIICDEGHKLKSASNKAAQVLRRLDTTRRVILSGTPIQNDLGEFFVMADFVNPGIFGTLNAFKRRFEAPIVRGRQQHISAGEREAGRQRGEELVELTSCFILRRTCAILKDFLPPKTELILFCAPTEAQRSFYAEQDFSDFLGAGDSAMHLKGITMLRKCCNTPALLDRPGKSGKLLVLERFLQALRHTDEKVVIVSQFTQTLDILETLVKGIGRTIRLDGGSATAKRQPIVDKFNSSSADDVFALLLSAKSGGCGLNLIGASRLVLFDSDWNPAIDMQAMARIHRDGQKRPVFIYRLLTTGMIDEKIYQRQVMKQGLADSLLDAAPEESTFSMDELRQLFSHDGETVCQTHDMLACQCSKDGSNESTDTDGDGQDDLTEAVDEWVSASQALDQQERSRKQSGAHLRVLHRYRHIEPASCSDLESCVPDSILRSCLSTSNPERGHVSFVLSKEQGATTIAD